MKSAALLATLLALGGCAAPAGGLAARSTAATHHVLRLRPGQDLRREVVAYAASQGLRAAVVVTCVGSVTRTALRYADRPDATVLEGKREIVSLVGTVAAATGAHLHMAVSDGEGRTLGGHLMDGSLVYTTAEIALAELDDLRFERERDRASGWAELCVYPR